MSLEQDICGYRLGRLIPSTGAYVVAIDAPSESSPRDQIGHLVVASGGAATTEHQALSGVKILDVGRTPTGALILVHDGARTEERESNGLSDMSLAAPSLFHRESTDLEDQAIEDSTASPASLASSAKALLMRKGNLQNLRPWFSSHAPEGLRQISLRVRRKKPLLLFVGVLVTTITILLLVVVARPHDETLVAPAPTTNGSATRHNVAVSNTDDALKFAISEVEAGRVPGLQFSLAAGSNSDGRVVSRSGEIVLVEVFVVTGAETTFATLLLQKNAEDGWRTRDVFDAAN